MNSKNIKTLRSLIVRIFTKSPKLKGDRAHLGPVMRVSENCHATEKQARRAMRLTCKKLGRVVPLWAQRLVHNGLPDKAGKFIPA